MRCFQCGNPLSIHYNKLHEDENYSTDDIKRLHAYLYPTCEWVKEILGEKYVAQILFDRTKSSN